MFARDAVTLTFPALFVVLSCGGRNSERFQIEAREAGGSAGVQTGLRSKVKECELLAPLPEKLKNNCVKRAEDKHKDALKACRKLTATNQLLCETIADGELDKDVISCGADGCLFDQACCDNVTCASLLTTANCGACGLACRKDDGSMCVADQSGVGQCTCLADEDLCPATGECLPRCDPDQTF